MCLLFVFHQKGFFLYAARLPLLCEAAARGTYESALEADGAPTRNNNKQYRRDSFPNNEKMIQLFLIGFVALHFVFSFRFHQRQIRERRIELVLGGERERERWYKTITSRTIETETSSEMTADQEATRGVPARPC